MLAKQPVDIERLIRLPIAVEVEPWNLVPGQPLTFRWRISSFNVNVVLGNVLAELHLDSALLYTSPKFPFVVKGASGDSGYQTAFEVEVKDPTVRKKLYTFGTHTLQLKVFADGLDKNKGPWQTDFDIEIFPVNIEDTWGDIRLSKDGGNTWVEETYYSLPQGANAFYAVSFTDANTGTIVGDAGILLQTTDGGAQWNSQPTVTFNYLYGVSFTDANTGTAVGYENPEGTILRTTPRPTSST